MIACLFNKIMILKKLKVFNVYLSKLVRTYEMIFYPNYVWVSTGKSLSQKSYLYFSSEN